MTEFERSTAVGRVGPGRFAAEIDTGWGIPVGPNGGYVAAIMVRALEAHVTPGRDRRMRSLTCHYLRTPVAGRVDLDVDVVRSGRRFSTGRLTARQDGKEVLIALASFAVPDLAIAATWTPPAPDVEAAPGRDAGVVSPDDHRPQGGCWSRVDGLGTLTDRLRFAPRFGSGRPFADVGIAPGSGPQTGGWMMLEEPQPIDAAYAVLCADAWWPPAFEALPKRAVAPTIDLTIHIRADLPPDGLPDQPILGRYRSSASIGGLVEEDGELFLADGTLLAQSRQLALLAPL
ncbi:MAG TPA: thioesterase family protein [Solirubrobacteraceae bacterium]|nr:thioesterase family protein [Solirubrobacteraceae bacterium]